MIRVEVPRPKGVGSIELNVFEEAAKAAEEAKEADWRKSNTLTANEYQRLAARTIDKRLTRTDMRYHALHGLASESGELQGLYQKIYQGHKMDEEYEKRELGDILWFAAEYCTARGWELEDVMRENIEKLKARYPEGFSAEKSLHRREGDV